MVRKSSDGSLDGALIELVGHAAFGAAVGALLLLSLGLLAELLRRRHRARRVLALLDLTLPLGVRTAVVSLLALTATFVGPRPVGAADSVRGWLGRSDPSTTTTTRVTVATPDAVSARDSTTPSSVPTGPVVLIPPKIEDRREPAPVAPAPKTSAPAPPAPAVPSPATPPAVTPAVTTTALPKYVVQRDDCLWSIAARLLGPGADARATDAAWRQIYAANRAAIGDNPNLIHVGLTLELPPLTIQP